MDFPNFYAVRQIYPRPVVADIERTLLEKLGELKLRTLEGKRIAITAGSRGIANMPQALRAVVGFLRQSGAEPFVIPAMGSHGGATSDGQRDLLRSLGITEETVGCAIVSSLETSIVGYADEGFPIHVARDALQADGTIVVNRVKPHTRFDGAIESGLMKMMLIGLGKHEGAKTYHRVLNHGDFQHFVRALAPKIIELTNIIAGVTLVDNAFEETAEITAIAGPRIPQDEPHVLTRAKLLFPKLPFERAELLIVDEIGKDISGSGMDTNVVGRKFNDRTASGNERPVIHTIYARRLTAKSGGNAAGVGIADMCHQQLADAIDVEKTYTNCITAGHLSAAMLPYSYASDREALTAARELAPWSANSASSSLTAAWIKNTKVVEWLLVSEPLARTLAAKAGNCSRLEISDQASPLQFDDHDNLLPFDKQLSDRRVQMINA